MSEHVPYAAAEGREFLRGELEDKPNDYVREFAGLVDDPETLNILNYYCSLWADDGEDFLDTHMAKIVLRNASTRSIDRAYRQGNVGQLKGMVGLTNNDRDGGDAITDCANRLADEGAIYLVLGPPGAGKTAYTLDVIRVWKAVTGGTVLANIDWEGADEVVTDSERMLEAMAETPGPVLMAIDEAGQSLTSRGSEQQVTNEFVKDLKYIRKEEDGDQYAKMGSVALIGHTRKDTAAEIRRLASGAFVKPTRNDPGLVRLLDSEGGADSFEQEAEYQGVTDTAEDYEEHEASHFEVVSEDDEDGEDVSAEEVAKDKEIEVAIKAVLQGHSQGDAAEFVSFGRGWVGNKWRDWKGGDYRDLVPVPDPLPDHVAEDEVVNA
jgi:energy-coupling factor transporter ATP-binding protein EcfA2